MFPRRKPAGGFGHWDCVRDLVCWAFGAPWDQSHPPKAKPKFPFPSSLVAVTFTHYIIFIHIIILYFIYYYSK